MEWTAVSGAILAFLLVVIVVPQSLEKINLEYLHQKVEACYENVASQNGAVVSFNAVRIGKTVEVYITIQNVADLYGFEINVTWNPLELGYVSHSVRIPVETFPDGILHTGEFGGPLIVKNEVNTNLGRYRIAAASLGSPWESPPIGAPPFNGCGNVVIITFEVKVEHCYTIGFDGIILADAPDGPSDPSDPISYAVQGGVEITPLTKWFGNDPIFSYNGELKFRYLSMNFFIRSIGYAGDVIVETPPSGALMGLYVGQPGENRQQYTLGLFESIAISIILWATPGSIPRGIPVTVAADISIEWADKTLPVLVIFDLISMDDCGNIKVGRPGGIIGFAWPLEGGSPAYLEAEVSLPQGWSYTVSPSLGAVFETPYTVSVNITVAENATEGDRGIIILKAFHADTSIMFWHFTYAVVLDTTSPIIEVMRPKYINYTQVQDRILKIEANVSDLTSGIEFVKLFYSINDGLWINKTMNWTNGDTFNSTKYSILIPLKTNETIKYHIMATDNVGHQTVTQNCTYIPGDTDWLIPYDVDILDVVIITGHYGAEIGQPNWDERADVDGNGKVDILDVVVACVNYSKKDP